MSTFAFKVLAIVPDRGVSEDGGTEEVVPVQGLDPIGPDMLEPGFKVLHSPDVDYWTTCATLKRCLATIRD